MKYYIQQRIETLLHNAVGISGDKPGFVIDGIDFEQWEYNIREGWLGDAWLATTTIKADNYHDAYRQFRSKLVRVVTRLSFVGQCYIEFGSQPFIITREGTDVGYFYDIHNGHTTGLMFMDDEFEGLSELCENTEIPEEFFLYWNEAVNTTGYSSKLLIMFSALEALVKKGNGKNDYEMLEAILGTELKEAIYTQKDGLRHRLSHGEHFKKEDFERNFVEDMHAAVVSYYNQEVFNREIISTSTVNPQRHPTGNKSLGRYFIRNSGDNQDLDLRKTIKDFSSGDEDNRFDNPDYSYVHGEEKDNF